MSFARQGWPGFSARAKPGGAKWILTAVELRVKINENITYPYSYSPPYKAIGVLFYT